MGSGCAVSYGGLQEAGDREGKAETGAVTVAVAETGHRGKDRGRKEG